MKWEYKPADIKNLAQEAIKLHQGVIKQVTSVKGTRTFKNTIEPLAKVDYDFAAMTTPM